MRSNPYLGIPATGRWDRSMARKFDPAALYSGPVLVRAGDGVVSAGSCFAANIVPHIEKAGLNYLRAEPFPTAFPPSFRDNFAYDGLSARYGNIYTPGQLLQLLRRARGQFRPAEDRWHEGGLVIDPFRPGLRYAARSDREFDILTADHLRAVLRAFSGANVFVFTLGLTEAWESAEDGAVYPACPGTIAGTFDPARHLFRNFSLDEIVRDLGTFITELREINPSVRMILTVSPVPLVATMEPRHVLLSTIYSKSVLRVAADVICRRFDDCAYFPAYEIVTGPQAPYEAYQDDRRNPSDEIIQVVMKAFLAHCEVDADYRPPAAPVAEVGDLARDFADAECEEEAVLRP